jgi:hypothetical protein
MKKMKKDPLLLLKIAVYGMGVMLVCGFVWLGFRLMVKAKEINNGVCAEITLPAAPKNTVLQHAAFEGSYWVLDYATPAGEHVLLRFEGCGKLVQKVVAPR